jgi:hypothetical protein
MDQLNKIRLTDPGLTADMAMQEFPNSVMIRLLSLGKVYWVFMWKNRKSIQVAVAAVLYIKYAHLIMQDSRQTH